MTRTEARIIINKNFAFQLTQFGCSKIWMVVKANRLCHSIGNYRLHSAFFFGGRRQRLNFLCPKCDRRLSPPSLNKHILVSLKFSLYLKYEPEVRLVTKKAYFEFQKNRSRTPRNIFKTWLKR